MAQEKCSAKEPKKEEEVGQAKWKKDEDKAKREQKCRQDNGVGRKEQEDWRKKAEKDVQEKKEAEEEKSDEKDMRMKE